MSTVEIRTTDGICRSRVYRQSGDGPWPGAERHWRSLVSLFDSVLGS